MAWLSLLVGAALARPLTFTLPEGVTPEILPAVVPDRVELRVDGKGLALQGLNREHFDGIQGVRASDLGGTWLITVYLRAPYNSLSLAQENGDWVAKVVEMAPEETLQGLVAPPMSAVLEGKAEAPVCDPTKMALQPLPAGALSARLGDYIDPRRFHPVLPRWTEAEPDASTQAEIAAIRQARATSKIQADALYYYALGAMHRDLGYAREAAYYFRRATEAGGDPALTRLQEAGALLAIQRWEDARAAAIEAGKKGAPAAAVLEVLGVVSLATRDPAPGAVGRALASQTGRPEALALAGALLLESDCPMDAVPVLQASLAHLPEASQDDVRLMLVDAQLRAGDLEEATAEIGKLQKDFQGRWEGFLRVRQRLLTILRTPADRWLQFVPELARASQQLDLEGAESLYLLAQIQEALRDERPAVEAYTTLLDRWPWANNRAVSERLLSLMLVRMEGLFKEDRKLEALALYSHSWHPSMRTILKTPEPLRPVANAFMELQLPDRAIEVLKDIAWMEAEGQLDDRETLLMVASMYLQTRQPEEAIKTLQVVQSRKMTPVQSARASLLMGQAMQAQDKPTAALAAWKAAMKSPVTREEALARRGMLLAETNCKAALPELREGVQSGAYTAGVIQLTIAQCELSLGNQAMARVAAETAVAELHDPSTRNYARWLAWSLRPSDKLQAALASVGAAPAAPPPTDAPAPTDAPTADARTPAAKPPEKVAVGGVPKMEGSDIWGVLAQEEAANAVFQKQINGYRLPTKK